jgi:hypothetical protein
MLRTSSSRCRDISAISIVRCSIILTNPNQPILLWKSWRKQHWLFAWRPQKWQETNACFMQRVIIGEAQYVSSTSKYLFGWTILFVLGYAFGRQLRLSLWAAAVIALLDVRKEILAGHSKWMDKILRFTFCRVSPSSQSYGTANPLQSRSNYEYIL